MHSLGFLVTLCALASGQTVSDTSGLPLRSPSLDTVHSAIAALPIVQSDVTREGEEIFRRTGQCKIRGTTDHKGRMRRACIAASRRHGEVLNSELETTGYHMEPAVYEQAADSNQRVRATQHRRKHGGAVNASVRVSTDAHKHATQRPNAKQRRATSRANASDGETAARVHEKAAEVDAATRDGEEVFRRTGQCKIRLYSAYHGRMRRACIAASRRHGEWPNHVEPGYEQAADSNQSARASADRRPTQHHRQHGGAVNASAHDEHGLRRPSAKEHWVMRRANAVAMPATPSPTCAQLLHLYCEKMCYLGVPMVAALSPSRASSAPHEWRCYARTALTADGRLRSASAASCSLAEALSTLLLACTAVCDTTTCAPLNETPPSPPPHSDALSSIDARIHRRYEAHAAHILSTHNFIHVPKTGGSTIEALAPPERTILMKLLHCCDWWGFAQSRHIPHARSAFSGCCVVSRGKRISPWHLPPDVLPRFLPANWTLFEADRPRWCIVRDPADRLASSRAFKMATQVDRELGPNRSGSEGGSNSNEHVRHLAERHLVFAFARGRRNVPWTDTLLHLQPQSWFVWDEDGGVQCDCVVAFERLHHFVRGRRCRQCSQRRASGRGTLEAMSPALRLLYGLDAQLSLLARQSAELCYRPMALEGFGSRARRRESQTSATPLDTPDRLQPAHQVAEVRAADAAAPKEWPTSVPHPPDRQPAQWRLSSKRVPLPADTHLQADATAARRPGDATREEPESPRADGAPRLARAWPITRDLQGFVERARVEEFAEALAALGAKTAEDLIDLDRKDLVAMGMPTLMQRRVARAAAHIAATKM